MRIPLQIPAERRFEALIRDNGGDAALVGALVVTDRGRHRGIFAIHILHVSLHVVCTEQVQNARLQFVAIAVPGAELAFDRAAAIRHGLAPWHEFNIDVCLQLVVHRIHLLRDEVLRVFAHARDVQGDVQLATPGDRARARYVGGCEQKENRDE